jgi:hypothetical protein
VAGTHIRHVNGKTFIVKNPTRGTGIGDTNARPTRSGRRRRKGTVTRDQRQAAFEKASPSTPRSTCLRIAPSRSAGAATRSPPASTVRTTGLSNANKHARSSPAKAPTPKPAFARTPARANAIAPSNAPPKPTLALNRRSQQNELERLAGKDRHLAARMADADRQMQTATPDEQRRLLKRKNRPHRQRRQLAGR